METNKSRFLSRRTFIKKSGLAVMALAFGKNTLFAQDTSPSWAESLELAVDFELKARGKNPYVAVWIEDWAGNPVRTLHLWMGRTKYLPDLRRWYRNERSNTDLMRTVSSPTRRAGNYSVIWDGKDDNGTILAAGEYYVCVESARQHGSYNLIRGRIDIGTTAFKETFLGDSDLGDVHVELRSRI